MAGGDEAPKRGVIPSEQAKLLGDGVWGNPGMGVRGVSPSAQSAGRRAHGHRPYAPHPDLGGCPRAVCEQARARPEGALLRGAVTMCRAKIMQGG